MTTVNMPNPNSMYTRNKRWNLCHIRRQLLNTGGDEGFAWRACTDESMNK